MIIESRKFFISQEKIRNFFLEVRRPGVIIFIVCQFTFLIEEKINKLILFFRPAWINTNERILIPVTANVLFAVVVVHIPVAIIPVRTSFVG